MKNILYEKKHVMLESKNSADTNIQIMKENCTEEGFFKKKKIFSGSHRGRKFYICVNFYPKLSRFISIIGIFALEFHVESYEIELEFINDNYISIKKSFLTEYILVFPLLLIVLMMFLARKYLPLSTYLSLLPFILIILLSIKYKPINRRWNKTVDTIKNLLNAHEINQAGLQPI